MHKAAATQSQRPTCGPPDAHRVSTVHPTRSWRREDRSHSQLWPHITACEMPTVRATTPHGQHGGTASAAEAHWTRQRAKPTRDRAVRRAEHQTAKGGEGAPTPEAPPTPEGPASGRRLRSKQSSALGNASASGCSASQHPTKPEQPSARTAQVLWGSTKHHPPKQTLTSATKVDTSSRTSLFGIHSSPSLQNR